MTTTRAAIVPRANHLLAPAAVMAVVIVGSGFVLLYTLDQKGLLPEEGVD